MNSEKTEMYSLVNSQLASLLDGCSLPVPIISNCAAIIWETMPDINWAGFYFMKNGMLTLGPFHGKVACMSIPLDRGVCGAAARTRTLQLVKDVHKFPGHIACDQNSRSEIVIPLIRKDKLIGVMDIDSPILSRFDDDDAAGLQMICQTLINGVQWSDSITLFD